MLNQLRYKFATFMQGRYGTDALSRFLLIFSFVLIIISMFTPIRFINILVLLLLVYIYFRMFSKNIAKRYAENAKFLSWQNKVTSFFKNFGHNASMRKDYHIYKCPKCGQKIRIPRGKGKIIVRCPKCSLEFTKRS